MIREVLKPTDKKLTITIPEEYVGREIEYIIFPLEEVEIKNTNITSLKGSLKEYANRAKIDLEKDAWKNHLKEKYNIDG